MSSSVSVLPSLAALLLVIALIPAALWLLRRVQGHRRAGHGTVDGVCGQHRLTSDVFRNKMRTLNVRSLVPLTVPIRTPKFNHLPRRYRQRVYFGYGSTSALLIGTYGSLTDSCVPVGRPENHQQQ